ncbi:unnamed protein product, partial [Phaeothamnion confervicola]
EQASAALVRVVAGVSITDTLLSPNGRDMNKAPPEPLLALLQDDAALLTAVSSVEFTQSCKAAVRRVVETPGGKVWIFLRNRSADRQKQALALTILGLFYGRDGPIVPAGLGGGPG